MKKPLLLVAVSLLVFGLLLSSPGSSHATWIQRFDESGVGNFDCIQLYLTSGVDFPTPALSNFSDPSWFQVDGNGKYAAASGDALTALQFDVTFTGETLDLFGFDFLAWNGSALAEAAHADWNGSGWSITGCDPTGYNPPSASVPEPATALLLGSGLLGLACSGRKKASTS